MAQSRPQNSGQGKPDDKAERSGMKCPAKKGGLVPFLSPKCSDQDAARHRQDGGDNDSKRDAFDLAQENVAEKERPQWR